MFITKRNVYQLNLTKEEEIYIQKVKTESSNISTLVFVDKLTLQSMEHQLVQKILKAANLNENQYLLVDKSIHKNIAIRHFNKADFANLTSTISFGLTAKNIGINTIDNKYHLIQINDNKFLFADKISDLQNDSRRKGLLWTNMKKMFDIK